MAQSYTLKDYTILFSKTAKELSEKIRKKGEAGYIPQGGVAVGKGRLYQAMVKLK